MPIRPENKHLYPKDWQSIRTEVLIRADSKCEFCGVPNHVEGCWTSEGFDDCLELPSLLRQRKTEGYKVIRIVLTIAHLDHDPTNNDMSNLRALCQRCHNRYDRKHRDESRKRNRYLDAERAGQGKFFMRVEEK